MGYTVEAKSRITGVGRCPRSCVSGPSCLNNMVVLPMQHPAAEGKRWGTHRPSRDDSYPRASSLHPKTPSLVLTYTVVLILLSQTAKQPTTVGAILVSVLFDPETRA